MTNDETECSAARLRNASLLLAIVTVAACSKGDGTKTAFDAGMARPDTYPIMLNKDMPFRYPPALYAEKVQGNVTLRLYIDKDGAVVDDSTRVIESAKIPTLDSAAIKGSRELKFEPAKLRGTPMPVSILFPVYFRHPDAPPPPGDSILKHSGVAGADSSGSSSKKVADSTGRKSTSSKSRGTTKRHRPR
ncbi:MAG: TonB family protein [Gemmatimonadota bacterium]|nr:TonB family protein [Gemmatimonadota bacterium]